MITPAWSHSSLSPQTNSSDPADSPNLSRRNTMFRSYRNLPESTTGYNTRISLRSSPPIAGSPSFRSHHLSSDLPSFWLQRSASSRNLPFNHSASVMNLRDSNPIVEDGLHVPSRMYTRNPGSNENISLSNTDLGQSASPTHPMSNPCHIVDDLHNRRSRLTSTRFGQNLEGNSGISESQISLPNRSSLMYGGTNGQAPLNEEVDRPLVFTNLVQNGTANTSRSLRNLTLENNSCGGSVPSRLFTRHAPSALSRALRRRVVREASDNPISSTSMNLSSTTNGVRRRERSLIARDPDDRRHSVPVRSVYRSRVNGHHSTDRSWSQVYTNAQRESQPRALVDREIHVRPISNTSVLQNAAQTNEAASTTSISGTSSIEDIRPTAVITPEIRRIRRQTKPNESADETLKPQKPRRDSKSVRGNNDWREDAEGSKELWRRVLLSERFVDVWFIVGGSNILMSCNTSSVVSPDPGAPGGPTSATKYGQNQMHGNVSSDHGSEALETNNGETTSHNDQHEMNATESYTLSKNYETDADSTEDDVTDVGSDLDEPSPGQTSSLSPLATQSIAFPTSAKVGSRSRFGASSYPPSASNIPNIRDPPIRSNDTINPLLQLSVNQNASEIGYAQDLRMGPADKCTPLSAPPHLLGSVQAPYGGSAQPLAVQCNVNNSTCWKFGAHKLILAAASPVFEAMFYGPVAEMNSKNACSNSEHCIPDIHPKAFQSMLMYIYTDEIELDDDLDIVFFVLYAAKKYLLPHLVRRCVEHLKEQLTASNVCTMLDRSLFFDEDDLTRRCWHVIDVLAPNVLTSTGLLHMDVNNLKALLKRDTLNCKEAEVFAAVREWAAAECARLGLRDVTYNRAQIAADLLHLVRFPTMTLNDFAENVAYSGFLSLEMVRDLFVHITTNNAGQNAKAVRTGKTRSKQNVSLSKNVTQGNEMKSGNSAVIPGESHTFAGPFPSEPRHGPKLWRCSRFTRTGKHLITPNTNTTQQYNIVFQVSNSVFLAGIGLYGSTQIGECLAVRIDLAHYSQKSNLTTGVNSVGTQYHGPGDAMFEQRSPFDHPPSAPATHNETRSSSLLEFARFDWSGRRQVPRRAPNQDSQDETIIHIPRDLTHLSNSGTHTESHTNGKSQESNSLAVIRTQIESDGSSRVHEVFFSCPVKVERNQRYVIQVQINHKERLVSASSSSTAMNSSSMYIGLFGRPEVRVFCGTSDGTADGRANRKSRQREFNMMADGSKEMTSCDSQDVTFYFSDNGEGVEHGEVDRGFLPELLFYTCS